MRLPQSDSFVLVWDRDPALDRERLDAEHAEDETRPNFLDAYVRALETLDFAPLVREGSTPTYYSFRPLVGMPLLALLDNGAGDLVKAGVAFRMAVREIGGGFKVERGVDRRFPDLGPMMTDACFAKYCEEGDGTICAVSLGKVVLTRSTTISPPS